MSELPLRRLTDLLNTLAIRCDAIVPTDERTLDDDALKKRVEDWFAGPLLPYELLEEVALLCVQLDLVGAAKRFHNDGRRLFDDWTDICFHDMAVDSSADEVAFLQQEYGRFPMPLADATRDEEINRDRWAALYGQIGLLGEYARSLLQSIVGKKISAADHSDAQTAIGPAVEGEGEATEHDWSVIVGTSRQLLRVLRTAQAAIPPNPARSRADSIQCSAVAHEIGNHWTTLNQFLTLDPRRTDGCHCPDDDTADMLWLCYQEHKSLRSAAIRLWKFVHQVVTPRMRTGKWPEYSNAELSEFEAGIDALELATSGSTASPRQRTGAQESIPPEAQSTAADRRTDKRKKLPRDNATRCAIEYVNRHRKKVAAGKVQHRSLHDLIAEFAGDNGVSEVERIERSLRPDRHGHHLEPDIAPDK